MPYFFVSGCVCVVAVDILAYLSVSSCIINKTNAEFHISDKQPVFATFATTNEATVLSPFKGLSMLLCRLVASRSVGVYTGMPPQSGNISKYKALVYMNPVGLALPWIISRENTIYKCIVKNLPEESDGNLMHSSLLFAGALKQQSPVFRLALLVTDSSFNIPLLFIKVTISP